MYRGKPVIVTDIFTDPLWEDYRDLAFASGLRACWSTPILSGRGKVLGSFAMYYRQPQTPTGEEARLTEVATHIAGLAIEHQRTREALARTQAALAHEAQREHIVLQTELADDLPSVLGDRVQLQQVLLNLVMNGMEAMKGIEQRNLELTVKIDRAQNGEVLVAVTDRGTGIKPQEIDR